MSESFIKQMENAIAVHPTLLMVGPPGVTEFRIFQSLYYNWMPSDDDRSLLHLKTHPDFTQLDARKIRTEEAREVRSRVMASPVRLQFRFLSILYVERLHPAAAQTFLKLAEEPPPRLRLIFSSECPKLVLPTLVSRSVPLRVPRLSPSECAFVLEAGGVDSVEWRTETSRADPRVATELDREVVEEWVNLWKALIAGATPPSTFAWAWDQKFKDTNESTELVCWNLLLEFLTPHLASRSWRDSATTILYERDRVIQGRDRKMTTANTLTRLYAYAKTKNASG